MAGKAGHARQAATRFSHATSEPKHHAHQLAGQAEQAAAPLSRLQNWPDGQRPVVQAGVVQAGAPVHPGRQVLQVAASAQTAQLAPQEVQAGAPFTSEQNWPAAHRPQSGWLQSAPFQPGAHLEQLVADVQDRLRG